MRVLIIGGTGFIGSHVVNKLCHMKHEVTVLHRGKTEKEFPCGATSLIGDRSALGELAPQIKKLLPDVIIDMIPKTAQDAWDLIGVSTGIATRLVMVSSVDVYRAYNRLRKTEPGTPDPVPLNEEAPLREQLYPYRGNAVDAMHPAFQYDKILVERLALSAPDLPTTILRLPVVYGPGDPQQRIFDYLKRMDDGRSAIILGANQSKWKLTRGYVEDVAAAVALSVNDASGGNHIYNVGEPDALTEEEWVTLIGEQAGWKGRIVKLDRESMPEHLIQGNDWKQDLTITSDKIRADLGYSEAFDRKEAIAKTIKWQRSNPSESIEPEKFNYAAEDAAIKAANNHSVASAK